MHCAAVLSSTGFEVCLTMFASLLRLQSTHDVRQYNSIVSGFPHISVDFPEWECALVLRKPHAKANKSSVITNAVISYYSFKSTATVIQKLSIPGLFTVIMSNFSQMNVCNGGFTHLLACGHILTMDTKVACGRTCYSMYNLAGMAPYFFQPDFALACPKGNTKCPPRDPNTGKPLTPAEPCKGGVSNRHILDCMHLVELDKYQVCGKNCHWKSKPRIVSGLSTPPPSRESVFFLDDSPPAFICPKCTEERLWDDLDINRLKRIVRDPLFDFEVYALPLPEKLAALRDKMLDEKINEAVVVYGGRVCYPVDTGVEAQVLKEERERWEDILMNEKELAERWKWA